MASDLFTCDGQVFYSDDIQSSSLSALTPCFTTLWKKNERMVCCCD